MSAPVGRREYNRDDVLQVNQTTRTAQRAHACDGAQGLRLRHELHLLLVLWVEGSSLGEAANFWQETQANTSSHILPLPKLFSSTSCCINVVYNIFLMNKFST